MVVEVLRNPRGTMNRAMKIVAVALMMILIGNIVAADTPARVRIVWVDDPDEVTVRDTTGDVTQADIGMVVGSGATVRTGESTVEMVLVPNGSVVVIDGNTTFRIDSLQDLRSSQDSSSGQGTSGNAFSLLTGRVRLIAAKVTGSSYSLRTTTTVAGVRGTDFYRMYDPSLGKDWICVTEGTVQLDSLADNRGVLVPAGNFVNLNNGFRTALPNEAWLEANLTLETLHGTDVPTAN